MKGYKFFKKGSCTFLDNSVRDERGFIFEEGKEVRISIGTEEIIQKGIAFHQLPGPYQYFPYFHKDLYEDVIFEVITLGVWRGYKTYSRSVIYADSVKVLRRLTKPEFEEIYRGWYIKILPETACLDWYNRGNFVSVESLQDMKYMLKL